MVFGVVHLVCVVVPGHDVAWSIAVPQQHTAFEHFAQTGAAAHPALCRRSMSLCVIVEFAGAFEFLCVSDEGF